MNLFQSNHLLLRLAHEHQARLQQEAYKSRLLKLQKQQAPAPTPLHSHWRQQQGRLTLRWIALG